MGGLTKKRISDLEIEKAELEQGYERRGHILDLATATLNLANSEIERLQKRLWATLAAKNCLEDALREMVSDEASAEFVRNVLQKVNGGE